MNTQPSQTTWFEITCLNDEVAGDTKTTELVTNEGVQTNATVEMRLRRMGQTLTQRLEYETFCDENGDLIRCDYTLPGGVRMEVHVQKNDANTLATITSAGNTRTIPCPRGTGGCAALSWRLRHPPMRPGEVRSFHSFEFGEDEPSETTLQAFDYETIDIPQTVIGKEDKSNINESKFLRIQRTTTGNGEPTQRWTLWCDQSGNLWKQTTELLGLAMYQVDEPTVRRLANRVAELDALTTIPVHDASDGVFSATDPRELAQLRCTVTLQNTEEPLSTFFPQTPYQRIVTAENNRVEYWLLTDLERQRTPPTAPILEVPPVEEDRTPNAWIESDSAEIVAIAQSVAAQERDPWAIVAALERETQRRIPNPGYESGFESALTALRRGAGDCTEHATLFTAFLRAQGMAARVASGLILEQNRAVFHAWTEVWLDGRWVGFPPPSPRRGGRTARYGRATADHLGGTGAIARLQRILPVVGNLRIEVTTVRATNGSEFR